MAEAKKIDRDIDFLFEMGNIRFIERMWRRFLNPGFANLAEHHFRMFWIAMVIAEHEGGNIDMAKIAKMVMVHDIAESRTGDVDYLARQYVIRNEELGIKDMLSGTVLQTEFTKLWTEYEEHQTIEAKIVKDADNLDVDFELSEQFEKGYPMKKRWAPNRKYVAEEKLSTQTAKKIAKALQNTDPHRWHIEGRTRFNSGDYSKRSKTK